jgi:hypothetical protein
VIFDYFDEMIVQLRIDNSVLLRPSFFSDASGGLIVRQSFQVPNTLANRLFVAAQNLGHVLQLGKMITGTERAQL